MFKNIKEGRLAALRNKVVAWWSNLQAARPPQFDLQALEDRVLYSATPLPIDATGGGAECIDASLEQLDQALWNALGQPAETQAGTNGSVELSADINSAGFLDESLANLDSLFQQYDGYDNTATDVYDHPAEELAEISGSVTSNSFPNALVVNEVDDEGGGAGFIGSKP